MTTAALTPEIEQLLNRYLQIQDEGRRLEEEKSALREKLAAHLADFHDPFWCPVVAGQALRIRVRHDVEVVYDEDLLRERLGETYGAILRPDPAKVRRHLDAVADLLDPALDLVGSPHREAVREAIESGTVPKEAFAGAFSKTNRTTIAVMRQRPLDVSPGDAPDAATR